MTSPAFKMTSFAPTGLIVPFTSNNQYLFSAGTCSTPLIEEIKPSFSTILSCAFITSRRLSPSLKVRVNGLPSMACPSFVIFSVTVVDCAAVVAVVVSVVVVVVGACPQAVKKRAVAKIPIIFFIRVLL